MWLSSLFRRRMSEPERPTCSRNPRVMCGERRAAMRAGEMFYSVHYAGWIFPAESRHVLRALTDHGHAPMCWPYCPFCGGPLPDVFEAIERWLLDDSGGEDGG